MTEPRGAVAGDTPATDVEPEVPGTESRPGEADVRPHGRLDASAHAHLLEEPLPPDAATETAIIYNVTLAGPQPDGDEPEPVPEPPVHDPTWPQDERAAAASPPPDAAAGPPTLHSPRDEPPTQASDGAGGGDDPTSPIPSGTARPAPDPTFARVTTPDPEPPVRRHLVTTAPATEPISHAAPLRPPQRRSEIPTARRVGAAAAVALVIALTGLSGYLWISATEWRDRAGLYERTAADLGDDLAGARRDLAGSQAELEAVRAQLATAHQRIVELADEKNQALDDWEMTQQVVDYQQRISNAAGNVARALGQCVQGQQELIGYLEQHVTPGPSTPPYDPALLTEFEVEVERLCQDAVEANIGLQQELAR